MIKLNNTLVNRSNDFATSSLVEVSPTQILYKNEHYYKYIVGQNIFKWMVKGMSRKIKEEKFDLIYFYSFDVLSDHPF